VIVRRSSDKTLARVHGSKSTGPDVVSKLTGHNGDAPFVLRQPGIKESEG
jgi:hypothetical protein